MEALSIAEKAKAYDEALSVAQETYTTQPMYRDWLAKMFPELKESEDEMIRKALIRFHKSTIDVDGIKGEDILAWLEKQGDNPTPINIDKMVIEYSQTKDSDFGLPVNCMIRAYRKGIIDALNLSSGIEKQDEQILANSTKACKIEHKFKIGDKIIGIVSGIQYYITEVCNDHYFTETGCCIMFNAQNNFRLLEQKPSDSYCQENCKGFKETGKCFADEDCKAKKEYIKHKGKQKQDVSTQINPSEYINDIGGNGCYLKNITQTSTLSEEDESTLKNIIKNIESIRDTADVEQYADVLNKNIDWLKSLKDRVTPQPKQEWSEEDAEMVEGLNNCLDELEEKNGWKYVYVKDKNVELTKVRNWLKLLKERVACEANCTTTKEWKPSKEQMDALDSTLQYSQVSHNSFEYLNSLYNDLKQLYA